MTEEQRAKLREAMAAIKANRDLLDACPGHKFGADVPGIEGGVGAMFGRKMKCERCGGAMDLVAINYYVRGYEAAGGDPNDVLPGWRDPEESAPKNERRYFGQPPE